MTARSRVQRLEAWKVYEYLTEGRNVIVKWRGSSVVALQPTGRHYAFIKLHFSNKATVTVAYDELLTVEYSH